jgi:hypothetical protein
MIKKRVPGKCHLSSKKPLRMFGLVRRYRLTEAERTAAVDGTAATLGSSGLPRDLAGGRAGKDWRFRLILSLTLVEIADI